MVDEGRTLEAADTIAQAKTLHREQENWNGLEGQEWNSQMQQI